MYAESLGTIPPNTGLLIVQDGDNRYEIRFEGTKQKSFGDPFNTKTKMSFNHHAVRPKLKI
jgi:hypothetical protein